jgi:hypothetical protein
MALPSDWDWADARQELPSRAYRKLVCALCVQSPRLASALLAKLGCLRDGDERLGLLLPTLDTANIDREVHRQTNSPTSTAWSLGIVTIRRQTAANIVLLSEQNETDGPDCDGGPRDHWRARGLGSIVFISNFY